MADKLKIYACSGIGSTANADQPVKYWTDDTNTITNTQAVNTLLAQINSRYIEATRLQRLPKEQKVDLLCDIDLLSVALDAAKRFADNPEKLHRAGEIIGTMAENGDFDFDSLDSSKREEHLHDLIAKANEAYEDTMPAAGATADWMAWWKTNVEDRNVTGLNFGQQQNVRKALKAATSGIGAVDESWKENADLAEYLTKGSEYFLYTYFTDEQIAKLPSIFRLKRKRQFATYNYCKSFFVDVYGSEAEMQEIIRAGIIDYFGETPEEICDGVFKKGKTAKIGEFTFLGLAGAEAVKALISIITAVGTIVVGIITAICESVAKTNIAKYGAIDQKVVETSVPDAEDWDDVGLDLGDQTGDSSSLITFAAIGAALLLLFKK